MNEIIHGGRRALKFLQSINDAEEKHNQETTTNDNNTVEDNKQD